MLTLSVAGPLVFGLPVVGVAGGADSNFNLQLVQGYLHSLQAGHLFPRWLPDSNTGFGSPVFYFYGRLPFLLAAGLALLLHLSAATGLLFGLGMVRLIAFFTCRAWLRRHSGSAAADCGALVFLAIPVVMMLNTIGRVGFAEATATALIPLLFLCLDSGTMFRHSAARQIAWLGLIYAALASTHLPQTLLAFAVASLYALLLHGFSSLLMNTAGAGCGLLLAGSSVVPAIRMQRFITPLGWRGDPYVDIRNNFLFTTTRFHQWHLIAQELYLYSSWLLCACISLVFVLCARSHVHAEWRVPRSRALFLVLCVCLLAMTKLFWPLWISITPLHTLQFPWRLFPASVTLAGGLVAILAKTVRRQTLCLSLVAILMLAQVAVAAIGAFASLSNSSLAYRLPEQLLYRLPTYVPRQLRESPAYSSVRSFPPEYIPAAAGAAGWHISLDQRRIVPGAEGTAKPSTLPTLLQQSKTSEGDITLHGQLSAPASIVLASFFFPDEELTGISPTALSLDAATGLTRITLPAGFISVRLDHRAIMPEVLFGDATSAFGALLISLFFLPRFSSSFYSASRRRARE